MRVPFLSFIVILLSLSFLDAAHSDVKLSKAYKEALKEYKASPNSYDASMKLASIAFDAGDFDQAYELVLIALEIKHDDLQALMLYANILIEYGHEAKARRKLSTIIALYPDTAEAKQAENNLAMLDRLHNPSQSKFKFKISGGVDSNPAHDSNNEYISNFMIAIACDNQGSDCDYVKRFKSVNSYVDAFLKGDYVYDAGKTGGFFFAYGWEFATKKFLENIDAGYLSAKINYGFGVATSFGSFHLPFSIGKIYSEYRIKAESAPLHYNSFHVKPHYRYRFADKSLFLMGLEHEEHYSKDGFDANTSSLSYSRSLDLFFLEYQTKLADNTPFNIKFYVGDNRSGDYDNQYYDINGTFYSSHVPYSSYNFFGLSAGMQTKISSDRAYKIGLNLQERVYFEHYLQNTVILSPEDYRRDFNFELDLQILFFKPKLNKYILGYKLYSSDSNYEPIDFIKHEVYFSYHMTP